MVTFCYFYCNKSIHVLVTYGASENKIDMNWIGCYLQIGSKLIYLELINKTYTSSLAESCSAVALGNALIFLTADLRLTNVAQPERYLAQLCF